MNATTIGRILVVDDQDNWREALTALLSKEGHIVESVDSFEKAKREISQGTFDLIVLDVRLADADVFNVQGLELLRLTKQRTEAPPVIILTGYPESIRKGVLKAYGADALIHKVPPKSRFNSESFKNQVQMLLEEGYPRRESAV
jgi:two-component system response regulator RegX3